MSLKKWIIASAACLVLLAAAFLFLKPSAPPLVKLPNPNGYDDLVKAGQMFVGDLPECYWTPPLDDECLEETRTYLKANSEALKLIRLGLSRESRIPIVYTPAYFSQHMPELAVMKRLAQTLAAEGKVAEKENRIGDAIQSYLDAARLHEKMRGGVMIDKLVGIAVEAIGVNSLRKISDQMTADQRRDLIRNLTRLYTERDSYDEIMANERRFINSNGLREQFAYFVMFRTRWKMEEKFQLKVKYGNARLGLFLLDLSVRNFESDNGRQPKTLQELVPKYLPFLPKDDFSGKDFIYRLSTNGFEVYGVGSDGIDNGGKPFARKGVDSPGDMLPNSQY